MEPGVLQRSLSLVGWKAWLYGLLPLACASAVRVLLEPVLHEKSPFQIFGLAVLAGAAIGGVPVGIVATFIGAIVGTLLAVRSMGVTEMLSVDGGLQLLLFAASGLGATFLAKVMRDSRLRAQAYARSQANLAGELARANRVKDEFLTMVSHELRTPLNSIVGWSALIVGGGLKEDEIRRGLASIHRNAIAQGRLIEDLLDLGRLGAGKLALSATALDLDECVSGAVETVRPLARDKEVTLRIESGRAGCVWADPGRMQQVVANLLSNALKFTPRHGQIVVTVGSQADDVFVRVEDSGPGIPEELHDRIFDKFVQADSSITRSTEGLGLGLAIVREIVALHGGTVSVRNRRTGGASFEVSLPRMTGRSSAVEPETAGATPHSLAGKQVLVVDDEADARELMKALLEHAGANVATAADVPRAIDTLRSFVPDVVVTDLAMPHRDGYDLLRAIHHESQALRDIPTAAVSAYASERDRALAAGFSACLFKPVSTESLTSTVERLARSHRRIRAQPTPKQR